MDAPSEACTKPKRASARDRLTREDWLKAGLEALQREGPSGLALAPLSRSVGVTTGSFYWHFENRQAYITALLDHWIRGLLEPAAQTARGTPGNANAQLQGLGRILSQRGLPELDSAMRDWARTNDQVAAAVRRGDDLRTNMLAAMFESNGFDTREARSRAEVAMWAWAGAVMSGTPLPRRARRFGRLLELLAKR